jgi:hypothetical protein
MDITREIFQATHLAIGDYMDVSGILSEDAIPERSLSDHMAIHLHSLLGLHAPNEEPYTRIAKHLGISNNDPSLLAVAQWKADIAIYDKETPIAVIENKIFSDTKRSLEAFAWDLRKCDTINLSKRIPIYGVALICETAATTGDLKSQKQWLERSLNRSLSYSKTTHARADQRWEWCIGCTREWQGAESVDSTQSTATGVRL